ncbi:hypothetical protein KUV65_13865 [Maritalea mobilis]|uniref:hypothetical protein n=1 Tax=Maritalea mobilis TaxID=483324 RepID=UPI001C946E9C|nr:hypothetical protein [Maritalea mobilis]MBY6202460.1 hypothetical protein [Maritalea mobilis]
MSKTAKSSDEIEDVLSSIRRLVSDHHASAVPKAQPGPAAAARGDTDKLVLTPALRVTDPDDPWAPVPVREDAGAELSETKDAVRPVTESVPLSEAEEGQGDWQPDDRLSEFDSVGSEADHDHAPDAEAPSMATDPEGIAAGQEFDPTKDMDLTDGDPSAEAQDNAPTDESAAVDQAVAELLGETLSDAPAEFEPETGDVDWPGSNADRALRELATVRGVHPVDPPEADSAPEGEEGSNMTDHGPTGDPDNADFTPIFSRRPDADMRHHSDAEGAGQGDTPIEAEVVDFDRALDTSVPGPRLEPSSVVEDAAGVDHGHDMRPGDPEPGRAMHWKTGPANRGDMAPDEADYEDLGDDRPFSFPEDETGILDEETLREIVAEVVREELQGALGQRITRNVRKMVRREIRLMLAADDLD